MLYIINITFSFSDIYYYKENVKFLKQIQITPKRSCGHPVYKLFTVTCGLSHGNKGFLTFYLMCSAFVKIIRNSQEVLLYLYLKLCS